MADDRDLTWELVETEHILQNKWIDFRRVSYRLPDGRVYEPFYTYSRRSYVVIAATDTEGRFICVRQYRQGINEVTTEFPAGGIERSGGRDYSSENDSSKAEDALEAAKRELREETGYSSDDWVHLITVPSNATIADNYAYVFAARGCVRTAGQDLDETEFLNGVLLTEEELEEKIHKGQFQQAIHVMAYYMLKSLGNGSAGR